MKRLSTVLLASMIGTWTAATSAAVMTYSDEVLFRAAAGLVTTEDFDSFLTDTSFNSSTGLDIGPFTVSIVGSPTITDYNFVDAPPIATSESDVNGTANLRVFSNTQTDFLIEFDSAITAFGADFQNFNDGILRTSISGAEGTIEPPVQSGFRFFGFTSDTPFSSLTFNGLTNDVYGIDNVIFGSDERSAPVPLPATVALIGLGLAGFAWSRRKRT